MKMKKLIIACMASVMLSACATSNQIQEKENLVLMNPEHNCNTPLYDNNKQLIQDNLKDRIVFEKLNGDCGRINKSKETAKEEKTLLQKFGESLVRVSDEKMRTTRFHSYSSPSGTYFISSDRYGTTVRKIK